jgi:hypothetical protein
MRAGQTRPVPRPPEGSSDATSGVSRSTVFPPKRSRAIPSHPASQSRPGPPAAWGRRTRAAGAGRHSGDARGRGGHARDDLAPEMATDRAVLQPVGGSASVREPTAAAWPGPATAAPRLGRSLRRVVGRGGAGGTVGREIGEQPDSGLGGLLNPSTAMGHRSETRSTNRKTPLAVHLEHYIPAARQSCQKVLGQPSYATRAAAEDASRSFAVDTKSAALTSSTLNRPSWRCPRRPSSYPRR